MGAVKGKTICIYGLYCPITDRLMYVGKANNMQKRLETHLRDSTTRKTPVYSWIRGLAAKGLIPVIKTLEYATEETWEEVEIRLIAHHRSVGKLLNLSDGGNQPSQTKEQRTLSGLKMNDAIMSMPKKKKKILDLKKRIGQIYNEAKKFGAKTGDWSWAERRRLNMVYLSNRIPQYCASWSALNNITHLNEASNGSK